MAASKRKKVGVFVCHCGVNISSVIDIDKVVEAANNLPDVAVARDYKFMCSTPGQDLIGKEIKELELDRVIVAACSPLLHEETFRRALDKAGINPYYFQMVNIREQDAWVTADPESATEKAIALVTAAV